MDFLMDWRLIDCLRNGLPVDMDIRYSVMGLSRSVKRMVGGQFPPD